MQKYAAVAQDTMGNTLAGATVAVYPAGTLSLATLYSDNLFTALAQPLTTGADGTFDFYAQNGRYDIAITKVGYTFNIAQTYDVILYDASSSITPAQISTNVNDYSPTNALNMTIWRVSSDTPGRTITGIGAGNPGQRVTLQNVGSFDILLSNQNVSSLALNRLVTGTGATVNLTAGASIEIVYDSTQLRWAVVSTKPSPFFGTFTRDTATASGTQAITGVGFKPSNVVFLTSIYQTTQVSIGFDNGVIADCIANYAGITPTAWGLTSTSILLVQGVGTLYQGVVSSMDPDGFTISWIKTGAKTGTMSVFYLALP